MTTQGLREDEMFRPMKKYLEHRGFEIDETNRGSSPGPDIRAVKEDRELIIEMKGHTKALSTDIRTCIGQICEQMEAEPDEYAVALSESYRSYIKDYSFALKRLGVQVFLVSEEGVQEWSGGS